MLLHRGVPLSHCTPIAMSALQAQAESATLQQVPHTVKEDARITAIYSFDTLFNCYSKFVVHQSILFHSPPQTGFLVLHPAPVGFNKTRLECDSHILKET